MGVEDAWLYWHMTPREIKGRTKAYTQNLTQQAENIDLLAWAIGGYVAQGYHDPKHYPDKPRTTKTKISSQRMEDDSMKDVLTAYAEIHNTIEGVGE